MNWLLAAWSQVTVGQGLTFAIAVLLLILWLLIERKNPGPPPPQPLYERTPLPEVRWRLIAEGDAVPIPHIRTSTRHYLLRTYDHRGCVDEMQWIQSWECEHPAINAWAVGASPEEAYRRWLEVVRAVQGRA